MREKIRSIVTKGAILALLSPLMLAGGTASAQNGEVKPVPRPVAAPAVPSPEDGAAMRRQEPYLKVVKKIRDRAEGGADTGYAGVELAADRAILWWRGTPPGEIRRIVRQAGVPVEVRGARYSKQELRAAAKELWRRAGMENGGQVHMVKALTDGSGLEAVRSLSARGLAPVPDVGVPVAVTQGEPFRTVAVRCDDSPDWYGGVAIHNDKFSGPSCGGNGSWQYNCTGGFGVTLQSQRYLLTAGHCGAIGDTFLSGAGNVIGRATHEHTAHDLLLVRADTGGRIWDGTPGVNDFTKGVAGWGWTAGGQSLCFSGTTSGAKCGYTVDGTIVSGCGTDLYGNHECYNDLISAWKDGTAGRPGDSGGPVFSLAGDRVQAMGTTTAYATNNQGREWIVFQDFGTATRDWSGLDVITG